jgi:hypothetical protein
MPFVSERLLIIASPFAVKPASAVVEVSDDLGCEEDEADEGDRGRAQDLESASDALSS